jgi:glycosyltransferase involved in cell wall biosynthesis
MRVGKPHVSILVTVYNREAFLRATLESILASSFGDFEVLVVDDCSKDNSLKIAHEIAHTDSRIKVHANEKNLGDYGNRMRAASLACGTYLKYVDSDDLLYSHSLGVMLDAMDRDTTVALALSHSLPEDEQPYPWFLSPSESYFKHFLGRGCFGCGPTGAIIRRSAFEVIGGFRKEWGVLSDIDLWLRLGARYAVALLPPGLIWWRRHDGQEFSSYSANLTYLQRGYELSIKALQDSMCPLTLKEKGDAIFRMRQNYARRLISLATKGQSPRKAWQLLRTSNLSLLDLANGLRPYR